MLSSVGVWPKNIQIYHTICASKNADFFSFFNCHNDLETFFTILISLNIAYSIHVLWHFVNLSTFFVNAHCMYWKNETFHTFFWRQKLIVYQDLCISYISRGEFKWFSKNSSSIGSTTELEGPTELALICFLPSWRSCARRDFCTVMKALKGQ